jgi:hypothetical protein
MDNAAAPPFSIHGFSLGESEERRRDFARATIYLHIYMPQEGQIVGRNVGSKKRPGVSL